MPIIDTWADVVRLINLALCALCTTAMAWDWREFRRRPRADQMLRCAVGAFVIGSAIASWETVLDPSPAPGIRTYLICIALSWLLLSILLDRRDRHTPTHSKAR